MSIMEQDEQDSDDDIIFPDLTNRNIYVRFSRIDDGTGKYSPHGRLPLMEARYSKVMELFGGGRYKAQAYEPDATGSPKIRGTRTWIIPGAYHPPMHLPGDVSPTSEPASTHVAGNVPQGMQGGVSMNEGLNMVLVSQILETVQRSRVQPTANPLLEAVLPAAIEAISKLMERKEPTTDPAITQLLMQQQQDIRELRAMLAAKPDTPIKSIKDTLEEMKSLRELMSGDGEKVDSESMMWAAGLKALEALTGPKAAPTPTAVNPQQAMLADPNTPIWKKVLRGQKQKILMAAGFGLDPYFAADTAIKTMPQGIHGAVIEFLQKPDHVELAMQELPELRQYENWTKDFFAAASEIMLGEPDSEEVPEGEVGDDASQG
jgi:hypothetical protein